MICCLEVTDHDTVSLPDVQVFSPATPRHDPPLLLARRVSRRCCRCVAAGVGVAVTLVMCAWCGTEGIATPADHTCNGTVYGGNPNNVYAGRFENFRPMVSDGDAAKVAAWDSVMMLWESDLDPGDARFGDALSRIVETYRETLPPGWVPRKFA